MSDISELMARDPMELNDKDVDEVIAYMRTKRAQFKSGATPTKVKVSAEAAKAAKGLDLGGLGL